MFIYSKNYIEILTYKFRMLGNWVFGSDEVLRVGLVSLQKKPKRDPDLPP
jgi:hypothetical protein